jgi:aromatic-L-amino-acid decarboxylase
VDAEEFRKYGHEVVDWIAGYLGNVRDYPVLPEVKPGQLTSALPPSGPETGESMERLLEDFRTTIVPALTHWNHPRFMAYFSVSASGPGILGEMLTAALNVNGMVWKSCPAVVELEQVTLGWLREWMGLPEDFAGFIYDTASISSMHAIAAAREMADPEVRVHGAGADTRGALVMYTSEHSHSSIEKGAIAVGVGQENVRHVPADAEFRMDVSALRGAIEADRAAGKRPFCVVATCGTTSTTSVDPIPRIADIAEQYGLWLHVDAAYAGPAAILPECRWLLEGAERAQSLVMNPHKWLFTPIDISAFYTSRPDILRRAFSLVPEYLKTAEDAKAVNLMDYGVPLGRRFRALKLWFVLRYYGRQGIVRILREHIRYAQDLAKIIQQDPGFEIAAPHPLSVVCFRYRGSDDENRRLMDRVNATGQVFLSHTVLNGRFVIRLAIGNIRTTWDDVSAVWQLVKQEANRG